jgi:hypothetical protein
MSWSRALIAWLMIVVAETIHGTIRQLVIAPAIGDLRARQIGVFVGSAIIFCISLACIRWIRAESIGQQIKVGLLWVVLISVFEFGLGAALGYSRDRMLSDYDLTRGGYMSLGLLFMLLAPAIAARIRGLTPRS